MLIHDVDGDGVLDIIASGNTSNEIAWYENQRPAGTVQTDPSFVRRTSLCSVGARKDWRSRSAMPTPRWSSSPPPTTRAAD